VSFLPETYWFDAEVGPVASAEPAAYAETVTDSIDDPFPASDPPANTAQTGDRPASATTNADVINNSTLCRFELTVGDNTGFLAYEQSPESLTLVHTEVPVPLSGQHVGEALVKRALDYARQEHLRIVVVCPFVRAYLRRHPPIP